MSSKLVTVPTLLLAAVALAVSVLIFAPSDTGQAGPPAQLAIAAPTTLPQPKLERLPVDGELDSVELTDDGEAVFIGWADAPGQTGATEIQIWNGNTVAMTFTADLADGAPAHAPQTGFSSSVQLADGTNELCAIATNNSGPDAVLGCQTISYRSARFDGKIIVADYGSGATPRLGVAGEGTPQEAAERIAARAKKWEEETGFPTIPAFDYIQTVAQASPGPDGDYSAHTSVEDLQTYLDAIRSVGGILILDLQPGGSTFMRQVVKYEEFLMQPDVGLALDTEWRMPWGVAPATVIGKAQAAEVNEVGAYLAGLVNEHELPQKPFVIHQFTSRMVPNRDQILVRPELATIFHIDGHGGAQLKRNVYKSLLPGEGFYTGFKLFFDEDRGLMTPLEVVTDLARVPTMVSYQ